MTYIHVFDVSYDHDENNAQFINEKTELTLPDLGVFPATDALAYNEEFGTPLSYNAYLLQLEHIQQQQQDNLPSMTPPELDADDSHDVMFSTAAIHAPINDPATWSSLFDEIPTEVPQLTSDLPLESAPVISMSLSNVYARMDKDKEGNSDSSSNEGAAQQNYTTKPSVETGTLAAGPLPPMEVGFDSLLKTEFEPIVHSSATDSSLSTPVPEAVFKTPCSNDPKADADGASKCGGELSEQEKNSLKRARNTMAARRSRARRLEKFSELERKCEILTIRNQELESEVMQLRFLLEKATNSSRRCMSNMPPL